MPNLFIIIFWIFSSHSFHVWFEISFPPSLRVLSFTFTSFNNISLNLKDHSPLVWYFCLIFQYLFLQSLFPHKFDLDWILIFSFFYYVHQNFCPSTRWWLYVLTESIPLCSTCDFQVLTLLIFSDNIGNGFFFNINFFDDLFNCLKEKFFVVCLH